MSLQVIKLISFIYLKKIRDYKFKPFNFNQKNSCLCELVSARESLNQPQQLKCLKEIKNAISKEAFRFSGFSQQVFKTYFMLF